MGMNRIRLIRRAPLQERVFRYGDGRGLSIKPSLAAPRQHDIPAVKEVCFWSLTLKSS